MWHGGVLLQPSCPAGRLLKCRLPEAVLPCVSRAGELVTRVGYYRAGLGVIDAYIAVLVNTTECTNSYIKIILSKSNFISISQKIIVPLRG